MAQLSVNVITYHSRPLSVDLQHIPTFQDIRDLVMAHKDDCPDQAITGKYILRWSENDDIRPKIR